MPAFRVTSVGSPTVLTSKWTGLNEALIASVYAVGPDGFAVDGPIVKAPITDGNIELTANWQSPFEQMGAETKAPAITAMLQSGTLQGLAETLLGKGTGDGLGARLSRELTEASQVAQGRTGLTKLNSTQVFTGAAPIKIPLTLHFRAFEDPVSEVRTPVDQLARWTLARRLAENGSLVSAVQAFRQGQGFLKALLPSEAPQMVALKYGGYTFSPLVIESLTQPFAVPRSSDGEPLNVAVQIVLASLTALDAGDWGLARNGLPTNLFNN